MLSLQKTYYRCNIVIIVLILFAAAGCAGKPPRPSNPSHPPQGIVAAELPGVPGVKQPVIRIGLKTDSKSVTFSSEKPLYYSDGSRTRSTEDALVAAPSFLPAVSS